MKTNNFTKILAVCLVCAAVAVAGFGTNKTPVNKVPLAEKNFPEKSNKSLRDPIEYVLGKLKDYDLVMIGERHWAREEPVFIQNLIKRCYEENAIDAVFLEFACLEDQDKIDAFLKATEYDPKPVIEILRKATELGWGYQEYFDIFKLIYDENHKRPSSKRIKLILASWSRTSLLDLRPHFFEYLKSSPAPEEIKGSMANHMFNSIFDRDRWMGDVMEMYRLKENVVKGIFYAGSSHIRKDMQKKGNGRPYFSAGGRLVRKYPNRIFCITFHMLPRFWQNENDLQYLEELFKSHGKPFAVDTKYLKEGDLKVQSSISKDGMKLPEVFDGYIMLNLNNDYHRCSLIPDFYDDEFAKVAWERLRKHGILKRFPDEGELARFKTKTPTGEELMKMVENGLF